MRDAGKVGDAGMVGDAGTVGVSFYTTYPKTCDRDEKLGATTWTKTVTVSKQVNALLKITSQQQTHFLHHKGEGIFTNWSSGILLSVCLWVCLPAGLVSSYAWLTSKRSVMHATESHCHIHHKRQLTALIPDHCWVTWRMQAMMMGTLRAGDVNSCLME